MRCEKLEYQQLKHISTMAIVGKNEMLARAKKYFETHPNEDTWVSCGKTFKRSEVMSN